MIVVRELRRRVGAACTRAAGRGSRVTVSVALEVSIGTLRSSSARARQYWTLNLASSSLCGSGRLVCRAAARASRTSTRFTSRLRLVFAHEHQHRVDRRMRAAAAGILLDRDAGLTMSNGLPPVGSIVRSVEVARAIEHLEEALLVLERARVRREAVAASSAAKRPLRAQWPTCSGFIMVPKFALRPDANEAAARARWAIFLRGASTISRTRRRAEDAQGSGRMPAMLVVMEVARRAPILASPVRSRRHQAAIEVRGRSRRVSSASANSAGRIGRRRMAADTCCCNRRSRAHARRRHSRGPRRAH